MHVLTKGHALNIDVNNVGLTGTCYLLTDIMRKNDLMLIVLNNIMLLTTIVNTIASVHIV